MNNPLILTITCVIVWCIWPPLARISKLQPATITFVVTIVTALTAVALLYAFGKPQLFEQSTKKGIALIILAGILNGIGMATYSYLLSAGSGFDISKYVVMISCLMPVGTVLFSWLIVGEHISMQKILSICIIVVWVYFLNKS